jgi:hypothetical protein
LFRASASALQQLAADPRFVGGQLGMLGVLQTWTRDLREHRHIHYRIEAIGLASSGRFRRRRNGAFLVPSHALAVLFRAKLRAALRQTDCISDAGQASGAAAERWAADNALQVVVSDRLAPAVLDAQVMRPWFALPCSRKAALRKREKPARQVAAWGSNGRKEGMVIHLWRV